MKLVINVFLLAIVLLPATVSAENVWHTSVVKKVYPLGSGQFVVMLEEDSAACSSGVTPNKYYYAAVGKNGVTQEGLELFYSTVLSAGIAGNPISIVFDTSTDKCFINRLIMSF